MIEFIVDLCAGLQDIVSPCAYDRVISTLAIALPCMGFGGTMYMLVKLTRSLFGGKL